MRSDTGTKSGPPCAITRATKSVMDFFTAPSFQEGRGSDWARAARPTSPNIAEATEAASMRRRLKIGMLVLVPSLRSSLCNPVAAGIAAGRRVVATLLAVRPRHCLQHLVDGEARRLLARREVPERLDESLHDRLGRHKHERPLECPVVVRVRRDIGALIGVGAQVVQFW